MRTVDPDVWSKKVTKPPLKVSRPIRFGVGGGVPSGETRLRRSLRDALAGFIANCSVAGVRHAVDTNNPRFIRRCYLLLLLSALCCGIALLADSTHQLWRRPPLTVSEQQLSARTAPFPAVALCSYNIISKAALERYSRYLYSLDKNNSVSLSWVRQNLLAFGALVTRSVTPHDARFMRYLEDTARETNVTNIFYQLSPRCPALLQRCWWRARAVRCSRLFALRLTNVGFCCVFNSRYSIEDRNNSEYNIAADGEDAGLGVLLRDDWRDHTLLRRPGGDVGVQIFHGEQFPLVRAGVVREYPARSSAAVRLAVRAAVQTARSELARYSEDWLGCRPGEASGAGGWSQCVAACRREAARALCACVPHVLPVEHGSRTERQCSLEHMLCMAKHREKLSSFYPGDSAPAGLSEEQADALWCPQCRTACARVRYSVDLEHVPLTTDRGFDNGLVRSAGFANSTLLRVFVRARGRRELVVETNVRWYQALASLSSQWVSAAGVPLLVGAELVFHLALRASVLLAGRALAGPPRGYRARDRD